MDLNELAIALNLPLLSMERNLYNVQVKDGYILSGIGLNKLGANTVHIFWHEDKVNMDFIKITKPKYDNKTKQMKPFSKKSVKLFTGDTKEAKEFLYNIFRNH